MRFTFLVSFFFAEITFYVLHCKICFLCLVALALFSTDVLKCFVVADFALSFGFNRQVDLQSQLECLKQIWQIWKILQQIKFVGCKRGSLYVNSWETSKHKKSSSAEQKWKAGKEGSKWEEEDMLNP